MNNKLHQAGCLFVLGVGPGDPDLLTLKAVRLLRSCALIAYPVGGDSGESFARSIAAPHIPASAREYGFSVPMRMSRQPAALAYDAAADHLAACMQAGEDVALLCEGDPFFYGSAMYLVERLATRFSCTIVPGITSLTACAAAAGRPLAARNDRLKVLPAPMDAAVLEAELASCEAAVIIKVGRHIEKLRLILRRLGLDQNALIVEAASGPDQKVTPFNTLTEGECPYFSTILIYKGNEAWAIR